MAGRFVSEFAAANGRDVRGVSAEALRALAAYEWPGNIRELRNVLERAVALCEGPVIQAEDLPAAVQAAGGAGGAAGAQARPAAAAAGGEETLANAKAGAESARIVQALQRHNNNRQRAAAELGISRMTLYKKLYRYGLFRR